jgi:hypothetical protein
MIAPLKRADVDIVVVFPYQTHADYAASRLIDKLRRALLKAFAGQQLSEWAGAPAMSRNGRALVIAFSDFLVAVLPALKRPEGGLLIPNWMTNTYIVTDPVAHVELWNASDAAHGGALKPLMRALKGWNRETGELFGPFHLEALCRDAFAATVIADTPSALSHFFDVVRSKLDEPFPDPAGYGGDLGAYLDADKIKVARLRLETALTRSARALAGAQRGDLDGALAQWRLLFGEYFPPGSPPRAGL